MNDDFVKLVDEMREAQKAYYKLVTSKDAPFKRHEISAQLRQCLRLESQVDKAIGRRAADIVFELHEADRRRARRLQCGAWQRDGRNERDVIALGRENCRCYGRTNTEACTWELCRAHHRTGCDCGTCRARRAGK